MLMLNLVDKYQFYYNHESDNGHDYLRYVAALLISSAPPLLSSSLSPFFMSSPGSYQVQQGQKVLLACKVTNLGKNESVVC